MALANGTVLEAQQGLRGQQPQTARVPLWRASLPASRKGIGLYAHQLRVSSIERARLTLCGYLEQDLPRDAVHTPCTIGD
ncbi:hypothetical protein HRbin15_02719 [bacterium HR15]|nr:hypothetical protein HRbin15_02719 [bacterium HR15]